MSTKTIVIQGVSVDITVPYTAGHALTEGEAKALNQVRAENIRNNMAAKVKEIKADAEELSQEQLSAIAAAVAEYDAAYEFTLASTGGGSRTTDPLEVECRAIARQLVSNAVKAKGLKLKDYPKESFDAKVAEVMELEQVVAAAKERLKKKSKLAEAAASALEL